MRPTKRNLQSNLVTATLFITVIGILFATQHGEALASDEEESDTTVSVLYATLRNHERKESPGEFYGDSRGQLNTGVCNMEFKPVNGLKQLADSMPFYIPDRIRSLRGIDEFPQEEFWKRLEATIARDNGNLVFYIHGYNIGFEKACTRAATFQRELDLHGRMLLFSWPANGNVLTYTHDEADLAWSVYHLEKFLTQLSNRFGSSRIDLVAHSLGARGVLDALTRIDCCNPSKQLFNELVLVAPDVDSQIFLQRLPQLRPLVRRITLYASKNDNALKLSHEVHGSSRLGEAGKMLTLDPGIETIDVSAQNARTVSGHIYHLHNPMVIADIKQLIDEGKGASQRTSLEEKSLHGVRFWNLPQKQ
jgi:pimeloyl-ACP methyl ester carboxylesterase